MTQALRRFTSFIAAFFIVYMITGGVIVAAALTTMAPVAPDTPVTIKTQVRFLGLPSNQAEIFLAAIYTDAEANEGLIIRLVNESSGWFPIWKLEVVAGDGWLPDKLTTPLNEYLHVLPLCWDSPETGDLYETILAYHPGGEMSISIHNATKDMQLFAAHFNVRLPRTALYPGVGREGAPVQVELVSVETAYMKTGYPLMIERDFSYGLVLGANDGSFSPTRDMKFFAGDNIGLRLKWPQMPVPGTAVLKALQNGRSIELLSADWQAGEVIVPFAQSLPPGKSTLQLDYIDGDLIHPLTIMEVQNVSSWARIQPIDLRQLEPADFSDFELFIPHTLNITDKHMPYYLAHFHKVANAVREDGFIDISVWRNQKDNEPYNARVMENILSLAFFYTTERPWNPYYGDPALRARLEAAMRFWVKMQYIDGRFSEYGPQRWNLPATAFATKFMGETLRLLHNGPPIDDDVLTAATAALRKAILVTLMDSSLYNHGKGYTNQYGNVWPGALAYLALHPDPEMESLLKKRFFQAERDFQSPAGYYYEADTVDWGYNMGTHRTNVRTAWRYLQGNEKYADITESIIRSEAFWYEWLSYNAVREPDGSLFFLNRGLESRQRRAVIDRLDTELAAVIPLARAFATSLEESAEKIAMQHATLERTWPFVSELRIGNSEAFSPYPFLHQPITPWFPTNEQREAAVATLPYLARDNFNHQRADDRRPLVITYIRRPDYYAIFNAGHALTSQQRLGLGLLWHPAAGTLLQTQSNSNVAVWGTKPAAVPGIHQPNFYETEATRAADYQVAGTAWTPKPGAADLAEGEVSISYPLGNRGQKTLLFNDKGLHVQVEHEGEFTEFIPLLKGTDDQLIVEKERVVLTRGEVTLKITTSKGVSIKEQAAGERSGPYDVMVIQLNANDILTYSLSISATIKD
jgi:hypothetical protein